MVDAYSLLAVRRFYSLGDDALHEHYGQLYALYSDSVLQTATPDEPRYLYSRVWKYQDAPGAQRLAIRDELEKEKRRSFLPEIVRNYSILAYNLALLYEREHNHTKWLENMILSGIADVYAVEIVILVRCMHWLPIYMNKVSWTEPIVIVLIVLISV